MKGRCWQPDTDSQTIAMVTASGRRVNLHVKAFVCGQTYQLITGNVKQEESEVVHVRALCAASGTAPGCS